MLPAIFLSVLGLVTLTPSVDAYCDVIAFRCGGGEYCPGPAYDCTKCLAGEWSHGGGYGCSKCDPGSYSGEGATDCSPCPAGTYQPEGGKSSCADCPLSQSKGATTCQTWEQLSDDGCLGDQPGFRRLASRLNNIPDCPSGLTNGGPSCWESVCSNMPALLHVTSAPDNSVLTWSIDERPTHYFNTAGVYIIIASDIPFERPSACNVLPSISFALGVWGKFDVLDPICGQPCPAGSLWDSDTQFCQKPCPLRRRHLLVKACDVTLLVAAYILQNFQNGVGQPPTALDILGDRTVQRIMCQVWAMSFVNSRFYQERGGWIYANVNNPQQIYVRVASPDRSRPFSASGPSNAPNPSIDLNNPNSNPGNPPPPGYVVVANFHSHPLQGSQQPSQADMINAYDRGVPGIVLARDHVYYYGPESRVSMAGSAEYPGGTDQYNGQAAQRIAWWACP